MDKVKGSICSGLSSPLTRSPMPPIQQFSFLFEGADVDGRLLLPLRSRDSISDKVAVAILLSLRSRDSAPDAIDATGLLPSENTIIPEDILLPLRSRDSVPDATDATGPLLSDNTITPDDILLPLRSRDSVSETWRGAFDSNKYVLLLPAHDHTHPLCWQRVVLANVLFLSFQP
jgi:hypothetical protein